MILAPATWPNQFLWDERGSQPFGLAAGVGDVGQRWCRLEPAHRNVELLSARTGLPGESGEREPVDRRDPLLEKEVQREREAQSLSLIIARQR